MLLAEHFDVQHQEACALDSLEITDLETDPPTVLSGGKLCGTAPWSTALASHTRKCAAGCPRPHPAPRVLRVE